MLTVFLCSISLLIACIGLSVNLMVMLCPIHKYISWHKCLPKDFHCLTVILFVHVVSPPATFLSTDFLTNRRQIFAYRCLLSHSSVFHPSLVSGDCLHIDCCFHSSMTCSAVIATSAVIINKRICCPRNGGVVKYQAWQSEYIRNSKVLTVLACR